jgi:hypothetical protein
MPRRAHAGRLQEAPQRGLVARRAGGLGRVVRQAEARRGDGGNDGAFVVGRDDGVEGVGRGEAGDLAGGGLGVAQIEGDGLAGLDVLEGLLLVGSDDGLDAEAPGGLDEVVRAVGGGGQQQEDALQTRSSIGM